LSGAPRAEDWLEHVKYPPIYLLYISGIPRSVPEFSIYDDRPLNISLVTISAIS